MVDLNERKAWRCNNVGEISMCFQGAIFTPRLHSSNEIQVYGTNPRAYDCSKIQGEVWWTRVIHTLKESDQIDFFMNGLDKSIKFVVQSHELTMEMEAYRKAITLESQHKA